MEGVNAGVAGSAAPASDEPRDARIVRELLRSMGVGEAEYEPRVVHQLLEIAYRYVVEVLSDAQVYADHAGKITSAIDSDDVRLAIQCKVNSSFSQPPPREVLLELARNRNKVPLPKSIAPPGSIPLPPDQDTLISPNYQLLLPNKQFNRTEETEEGEGNPNPNRNSSVLAEIDQVSLSQMQQRVSFQLASASRRMI
ncbi:hypothetical protein LUZ60_006528 [Juncus effusus]|nr:hypothetical protein LUZ60_006528 [Juncus effusus]